MISQLLPLLLAANAATSANPELARAEALFAELKYAECAAALDTAWARRGTELPAVLRILELEGTVAALLSQPDKARSALRRLFLLSPDRKIDGDLSPRLRLPLYEAKAWAAEKGALRLVPLLAPARPEALERVGARLTSDPLGMGKRLRFHLRPRGGGWSVQEAPLEHLTGQVAVSAPEVQWWVELLDERERVLLTLGSESSPQTARAATLAAPVPAAPLISAATPPPSRFRPVAYAAVGTAVVAAGVGADSGVQSAFARGRLERPVLDEQGRVTGLKQSEVPELNAQLKRDALIADVLFGASGALAITGVSFWIAGMPARASPTVGGVAISGALPVRRSTLLAFAALFAGCSLSSVDTQALRFPCQLQGDCAEGYVCSEGECLAPSPSSRTAERRTPASRMTARRCRGMLDAGTAGAGTADAGAEDAGEDAGQRDAGACDGGGVELCGDGLDNDCDGKRDCQDTDCNQQSCVRAAPATCP